MSRRRARRALSARRTTRTGECIRDSDEAGAARARQQAPRHCRTTTHRLEQDPRGRAAELHSSTYLASSLAASSNTSSLLPDTCHRPVTPGLTSSRVKWLGLVVLDLAGLRRPGADQAHVPAQHVPELRQLVDARLAQDAAEPGDAWIAVDLDEARIGGALRPQLASLRVRAVDHRAELDDAEDACRSCRPGPA